MLTRTSFLSPIFAGIFMSAFPAQAQETGLLILDSTGPTPEKAGLLDTPQPLEIPWEVEHNFHPSDAPQNGVRDKALLVAPFEDASDRMMQEFSKREKERILKELKAGQAGAQSRKPTKEGTVPRENSPLTADENSSGKPEGEVPSPKGAEDTKDKKDGGSAPSHLYLEGHLTLKDATELESEGNFAGAFFKLKNARDLFDAAHAKDHAWQPEIVEFRRRKVREEMERVRRLEIGRRAAAAERPDERISEKAPSPEAEIRKARREAEPGRGGAPRERREDPEIMELRRRLHQAEQALESAHRREAGLRGVVRDLLNEISPPPPPSRPFPPTDQAPSH